MLVYVSPGLAEMFGHAGEPADRKSRDKKGLPVIDPPTLPLLTSNHRRPGVSILPMVSV
jgi:hypothetical protein